MTGRGRNLRSQTGPPGRTNEGQSSQAPNPPEGAAVDDVLPSNENEEEFEDAGEDDDAGEGEDAEEEGPPPAPPAPVAPAPNVRTNQANPPQERIFGTPGPGSNPNQAQAGQGSAFPTGAMIIGDATQNKRPPNFKGLRRDHVEAHN